MKKILAIAVALVLAMALTVSVFAEDVVYEMTTTQGQEFEGKTLPTELVMNDGYCRLATNWVGGGSEYSAIIAAINTADATLVITYTGTISQFIIQTENGGSDTPIDLVPTEVDGKNVAAIACADIIAAMPVGCGNDNVGWGNIAVIGEDGAMIESFKVVTGYAAAAAPAEDNTPAPEPAADTTPEPAPAKTETPAPSAPQTGLALAVVPAVMALAAVAVSKKH